MDLDKSGPFWNWTNFEKGSDLIGKLKGLKKHFYYLFGIWYSQYNFDLLYTLHTKALIGCTTVPIEFLKNI